MPVGCWSEAVGNAGRILVGGCWGFRLDIAECLGDCLREMEEMPAGRHVGRLRAEREACRQVTC